MIFPSPRTSHSSALFSLAPFCLCLLPASPASADGVFKGRVFIPCAGGKDIHCYEMHLCLSRDGGGYGAPLRIGVIPKEDEKFPASSIHHNGDFLFHLTPGRYTAIVCEPRFFPRGHVFRDIVIEEGKTLERDLPLPADLGIADTKTGPWGTVCAQSFKANGTSIIKISVKPAGIDDKVQHPHIKVIVHEGSLDGPAVGPARVVPIHSQGDVSVAYRHGDVTTMPGKTYVVEMRPCTGDGADAAFGWIPYVGPAATYADGTAILDGKPIDYDFHMVVQGDADGVIQTLGRISGSDFKSFLPDHGWSHVWAQTFKAKGNALAGVDWYATAGFGKHIILECTPYDGPDGKPIGPAKTMHMCSDLAYGVSWSPGEVPLEKGKTYCVRFRRVDHTKEEKDHSGFNFYRMRSEDYADGQLFTLDGDKLAPSPGADADIRIFEYEGPAVTATSASGGRGLPPPSAGGLAPKGPIHAPPDEDRVSPSVFRNGDFEREGKGGVPDGWTAWKSNVGYWQDPAYWNNKEQGRGKSRGFRILGGHINGCTFDGGAVQKVSGLDPKKKYQLVGHVAAGMPYGAINGAALGWDASGQTDDFRAVTWLPAESRPDADGWLQLVSPPFSPPGGTVSVWTRAWLYFFECDTTYYADFDDVQLVELKD